MYPPLTEARKQIQQRQENKYNKGQTNKKEKNKQKNRKQIEQRQERNQDMLDHPPKCHNLQMLQKNMMDCEQCETIPIPIYL